LFEDDVPSRKKPDDFTEEASGYDNGTFSLRLCTARRAQ
jgi:hypothetical protein